MQASDRPGASANHADPVPPSNPVPPACETRPAHRVENTVRSDTGEIRQMAIGAAVSGDLEACRLGLDCGDLSDHERAVRYCRLSEALYHRESFDEAVECACTAFELQADNDEVANLCAWVFSNCGRHKEAAAAYERLLLLRPQWAEGHRHASGSFAAAGRLDRAIIHGRRASDLDPDSCEFALHAGCLLEAAGRHAHSVNYLMRAVALDPADARVLRHLSTALHALGQSEQAVTLALRALAIAPTDRSCALHATELLLRAERYDERAGNGRVPFASGKSALPPRPPGRGRRGLRPCRCAGSLEPRHQALAIDSVFR